MRCNFTPFCTHTYTHTRNFGAPLCRAKINYCTLSLSIDSSIAFNIATFTASLCICRYVCLTYLFVYHTVLATCPLTSGSNPINFNLLAVEIKQSKIELKIQGIRKDLQLSLAAVSGGVSSTACVGAVVRAQAKKQQK